MYTVQDFKTKKALKEAVEKYNKYFKEGKFDGAAGAAVHVFQPGGMFPTPTDGKITLEGPHYPKPHTWYAEAWLEHGVVVKVK
jgi:hypothetical protein